MRFSDHHYTIVKGGYPKIHDKLKNIILIDKDIKGKVVLDAGACTGSFGLWAMANGAKQVIIMDKDPKYIERAKEYAKIHADMYGFDYNAIVFQCAKVDATYELPVEHVDTVIARRFIYELRDEDVRRNFIGACKRAKVDAWYIQGLVPVKNHREPLWNLNYEIDAVGEFNYLMTASDFRDVARMQLDDGKI